MTIQHPAFRCLAEDCVRAALPKWKNKGVRVANHAVWLDGQEMEWLSIFTVRGGVKILQHFPTGRKIGELTASEVRALTRPRGSGITPRAIRGHVRHETRRRA